MLPLPIDAVLPQVLAAAPNVVVVAPPGSGKSTRIPPALLGAVRGRVYLLQPRRVAARALARRISDERGTALGAETGYRVRFERVGTRDTRLWVMTEGSLTRELSDNPFLEGVDAVVLDEFHERSLHTDLALACLRELQRTVRPELRLIVMSATIDPAPVAAFLEAPVIDAPGRTFPVTVRHAPATTPERLEDTAADAIRSAISTEDCGDILVFLPGTGEIRGTAARLADLAGTHDVLPLHGSLPPEEQDRALRPGPRPRIVLSTNVAETSVTVPGVRTVIDSGLARINRFDPATGLDALRIEPISRHSAEQRAGRAGRTAPGRCIRLWSQTTDARRPLATDPEIRRVDLAPTLLALKGWGTADARTFPWFEPPESARLVAAEELLALLGTCAAPWAPASALGRRMAALPTHPRLARLLCDAQGLGLARLGATLAALTGERDVRLPPPRGVEPRTDPASADALDRLHLLDRARAARFAGHLRQDGIDPGAAREADRAAEELLRAIEERPVVRSSGRPDVSPASNPHARATPSGKWSASRDDRTTGRPDDRTCLSDDQTTGRPDDRTCLSDDQTTGRPDDRIEQAVCRLLLAAYPDRVAVRAAPDANRGMMTGGVAVTLAEASAVAARKGYPRPPLFLATVIQGVGQGLGTTNQVRQAAELDESDLEAVFPGALRRQERLAWDATRERVEAQVGWWWHDLAVRVERGAQADPAAVAAFLAARLAPTAEALVLADEDAGSFLRRLRWLAVVAPDLGLTLPNADDLARLIADCCAGCRSRDEVLAKPKRDWLNAVVGFATARQVDDLAPAAILVPTGNRIRLDYSAADATRPPILAVRLQELFGQPATPTIAGGRVGVLLHLLGPNYRCEQVTRDLASFWGNTYPQVRKDLRGRYPKHSWPDDPLTAPPVAKGRPRAS